MDDRIQEAITEMLVEAVSAELNEVELRMMETRVEMIKRLAVNG
jgi:hypothetical protein